MFFGSSETTKAPQDRSVERRAMVAEVIRVCEACFPSISIRLVDNVKVVNAQASQIRGALLIDLFGGLAFHPTVGRDALAFTLVHEAGHHFGRGPRIAPNVDMACDCAADRWAIAEGIPRLAKQNFSLDILAALTQLQAAAARFSEATGQPLPNCWCWDWGRRRQVLKAGKRIKPISSCAFVNNL
ncbi:hypothetical protein ACE10Z_01115 [Bradyrhizobium sp. Pha-3]|uniref:hypothetical protein n=1 Tax=Bradyrhizobium sp. Pha-3 TaxID=208375 RepID=UPI0035D4A78C